MTVDSEHIGEKQSKFYKDLEFVEEMERQEERYRYKCWQNESCHKCMIDLVKIKKPWYSWIYLHKQMQCPKCKQIQKYYVQTGGF